LGGSAFKIDRRNKPLYHAFGAFLSPLLVVHLKSAFELAVEAGIPPKQVATFMGPILTRTLENLLPHLGRQGGAGKAFSGPLVRGDLGTIEKHLQILKNTPAGSIYRALVNAAIQSDLPIRNRSAMRKLLRARS
jgi:predicted short-subunit dehydrogenase-like oxidoreductase (DUF2520 family)